ncbi:MAG: hypothetical protein VKM34_00590 [Cyanobacteriota bacterium]|nr:hypothetical protein [Cyanobacteriota bacterium]
MNFAACLAGNQRQLKTGAGYDDLSSAVLPQNLGAGGHTLTIIKGAGGDALEIRLNRIVLHGFRTATHEARPSGGLLIAGTMITSKVGPEGDGVDGHD